MKIATNPISIHLLDGRSIKSTHTKLLNLEGILPEERKMHICPDLQYGSLISIKNICDVNYDALLRKIELIIIHRGRVIAQDQRHQTGLWKLRLQSSAISPKMEAPPAEQQPMANPVLAKEALLNALTLLHVACFSPTVLTWCRAIVTGYFATWTGSKLTAICKEFDQFSFNRKIPPLPT